MTDRVKANAALLLENEMPDCLVRLAANTAAYDVLAVRWEDPHFMAQGREDYVAPDRYSFPRTELHDYVGSSFKKLKAAQQDLLGKLGRKTD
ncbi:MAG TPA: hypothetical protein VFI54_11600 [Solirubrobacteraceae bacterium]|nr:hypothetical protein [Solirubrobacteraceae bacterium]